MINSEAVIAQARSGNFPAQWQVWRAKESFFYWQAGLAVAMLALATWFIISLIGDPNHVTTIGAIGTPDGGTLDDTSFRIWRIVDFSLAGILGVGMAFLLLRSLAESAAAKEQLFVLMPEGFVMSTKKTVGYDFASLRGIKATNTSGVITLQLTPVSGAKATNVSLDGRFGNAKKNAQMILNARNQFAASHAASMQAPAVTQ